MDEMMNMMKIGAFMGIAVFMKDLFSKKVIVENVNINMKDGDPDFSQVTFTVAKMGIDQQSEVFKFLHQQMTKDIKTIGVQDHLEPLVKVDETTIIMRNKVKNKG